MSDAGRLPVESDRAQLLLVGAVAIGLILLGLVLVYNTILFTDTQEPTQSLDDGADTRVLRQQVVNDTRLLVQALHEDKGFQCGVDTAIDDTLKDYAESNVTTLGEGQTYSQAFTSVKFVDINNVAASCLSGTDLTVAYDLTVQTPETEYSVRLNKTFDSGRDFSCDSGGSAPTVPLKMKTKTQSGGTYNVTVEFTSNDTDGDLDTGYVYLTNNSSGLVTLEKIDLSGDETVSQTVEFTNVSTEPDEAIVLVEDESCASATALLGL